MGSQEQNSQDLRPTEAVGHRGAPGFPAQLPETRLDKLSDAPPALRESLGGAAGFWC